jgi:lipopolysaccharide transport system ATP-binding protein
MNDIAIRVNNLSKCYQIYDNPRDRLKQFVIPTLQRFVGHMSSQFFQEFWALKDVSIEVKRGEPVGIIGRNGSGKSTLLQIICGTLSPTGGQVETMGRIAALLELGSGFNPEFSGRENVYLVGAVLGLSTEEIDNRFDDIAAFADIGDFLSQPTKTYSSGMLMRLAFAVNTCVEPEILIIDEALSVGDSPFQAKCFKRLRQMIANGTSILLVTHDISTVRSICSRALWLKHGHTEGWGEATHVASDYEKFCWQEQGVVLQPSQLLVTKDQELSDVADGPTNDEKVFSSVPPMLFEPNPIFQANRQRSRFGTEAVVIKNFLLLKKDGSPALACEFDEDLALHYLLEVCEAVNSDFVIGVRLRDLKGHFVYSANDINSLQRIEAIPGDRFVVSTNMRIPLTHQDYVLSMAVFGFKDGTAYTNGMYDFSKAVIWDQIEDAAYITVYPHKFMPLPGPVNTTYKLEVRKINGYVEKSLK